MSISIMPTSVSSDLTPEKTPHTTTIGNYQTDRNGRRFRTLDQSNPTVGAAIASPMKAQSAIHPALCAYC